MQSPQPHPHPQQHQQNDHQQEKNPVSLSVIIGAILVGILALICGVGALGTAPIPTHTSAIATRSQAQPDATLGGTLGDFVKRYGTSIDESGLMYAATLAGQRVLIIVTLDAPHQSRDGRLHIIVIDAQVPGDALGIESWSGDTADAIARAFLPTDAQFQRIVITHDVADHVYYSVTMATIIMPGQYTNVAGTLNYSCYAWPPSPPPSGHASGYGQCHIAIGSEYPQNNQSDASRTT